MSAPRFKWPTVGVCRVCGCVDERACPEGCSWVDADHTLCSVCAGTVGDLEYVVRWCFARARRYGVKFAAKINGRFLRSALKRCRARRDREAADTIEGSRG